MTEDSKNFNIAINLMRMALALLDRASEGASETACHLQAALNAAPGAQPMQEGDELDRELVERLLGQTKKSED